MEDYRLSIPFDQFEKALLNQIELGRNILKYHVGSENELKSWVKDINTWGRTTDKKIKTLFISVDNEIASMFYYSESKIEFNRWDRFEETNMTLTVRDIYRETYSYLEEKIRSLCDIIKYSPASDLIKYPDTDILNRINMKVEEKKDLILSKLYQLNTGEYHNFKLLLSINGVALKYKEEQHELALNLKKGKYIDLKNEYSDDIKVRITIDGVSYIEKKEKIKPRKNNLKKSKDDYKSICDKIDDVISRLGKMELKNDVGQEILFTEIEELKGLYLKLNKKNWKQMVLGKLADLSIDKVVENETVKFIYERLTGDELKLLS
jgi:hypothetical protein